MARFTRWLMVGSVVASSLAGQTAEACWLFGGCCGGAPRTTFYAPAPVPVCPAPAPVCPTPCAAACNPCDANPCNTCNTGLAATTFAQPTTAMMPVTAYRPMLAGTAYSAGYTPYAAATPYTVGYTPLARPAWATAPYTSYRPVAVAQTSYAAPVSYTAPVTVQYAPQQPVSQATYYAQPTAAPVAAPAPGCNCHSSTSTGVSGQYWNPNSNTTVVQTAPITTTPITSGPTNGNAVMTSGSSSTFGNNNLGSQGVLQNAPQPTPVNNNQNVQPVEDPIKKSSNTAPSYEDPSNKTAYAPIVRSLDELAPYNPVRMTSNAR